MLRPARTPSGGQLSLDLGVILAREPGRREGDGARDVATARLSPEPPAVERGRGAKVDNREVRVAKAIAEFRGGYRGSGLLLERF